MPTVQMTGFLGYHFHPGGLTVAKEDDSLQKLK
jgi:hypothetical protein